MNRSAGRKTAFALWVLCAVLGLTLGAYGLFRESFADVATTVGYGEGRFGEGPFGGGLRPWEENLVKLGVSLRLLPFDRRLTVADRKQNAAFAIGGVLLLALALGLDVGLKFPRRDHGKPVEGKRLLVATKLWLSLVLVSLVITFLAERFLGWKLATPILAATLVAVIWYSYETRRLRVQHESENEVRCHPWLKASDLKPEETTPDQPGWQGKWVVYLPVSNRGSTPAYDLSTTTKWRVEGSSLPREGKSSGGNIVIVPGDTWHSLICEIPILNKDDRPRIAVEISYKTFQGGSGHVALSFFNNGSGWENGPISYECLLCNGWRFPASAPVAT